MTKPTDEAAKLARECAEAVIHHQKARGELYYDQMFGVFQILLRPHLASKDAEIERLREAAIEAGASLMEAEDHLMMGNYLEEARDIEMRQSSLAKVQSSLALLRAALQPQESTNEQ